MAVKLRTGKTGDKVTSASDRRLYAGIVGKDSYVMNIGAKCSAALDGANKLVVQNGSIMHCGAHIDLEGITEFTIPSGVQAKRRAHLCCIRYTINEVGVEKAEAIVISGEPTDAATPEDPVIETGSILDRATISDMPLYRVVTDGINAQDPVPLYNVLGSAAELWDSQSRKMHLLWTGNAVIGNTITAPNIDDYFMLVFFTAGLPILMMRKDDGGLLGGMIISTYESSSARRSVVCDASKTGTNTIKVDRLYDSFGTCKPINKIYGIL